MRRFFHALRSAFYKTRLEREMEEEIAFHLDMRRRDGHTDETARARFGNVVLATERMRDTHTLRFIESVEQDVRYAFRALMRSPVFTAVAVVSLALGIGANSAIFTVTNAVLLKMLPVERPEALRLLTWSSEPKTVMDGIDGSFARKPGGRVGSDSFSYPVYLALRKNPFFEDMFAFKARGAVTTVIGGQSERTRVDLVSGNLYSALGVRPIMGRAIGPEDDVAGTRSHVIVLGYAYWKRRFAGSAGALNSTIRLNDEPFTVIGVNPPNFDGFRAGDPVDLFVPLASVKTIEWRLAAGDPNLWWVNIMGRMKPGVAAGQSIAAMNVALHQAVLSTLPQKKDFDFPKLDYKPGGRMLNRDYFKTVIYLFSGLVGLVLMIACTNLASLLLARATSRTREIAVRLALGAGRWRIVRQILTESLVLAVMGGVAGIIVGYLGKDIVPDLMGGDWDRPAARFPFDYRVLAFTAALSLVTALVFGLIPALRATRPNMGSALKAGGRGSTQSGAQMRVGKLLVISQIALSILLLVAAGLFSRTLVNLRGLKVGFNPERILLLSVSPPQALFQGEKRVAMFERVLDRLRGLPGIQSATMSSSALLSDDTGTTEFFPEGRARKQWDDNHAYVHDVGTDYFQTMGIPILAGRGIDARDSKDSRKVAVINQALAREFYPHENPLGKIFNDDKVEIVGICGDSKYAKVREGAPGTYYRPGPQSDAFFDGAAVFALKTAGDPLLMVRAAREAVSRADPNLVPFAIRSQEQQIDQNMALERAFASMAVVFGAIALLLASVGIYGIMAYNVARRTGEMGIRMALGAQKSAVLGLVLRETLAVAGVGVALGLAVAMVAARSTASLLYNLKPYDPLTLAGAALVMLLFACASGLVPARRAASIEPGRALREE
jgi:predicted permease